MEGLDASSKPSQRMNCSSSSHSLSVLVAGGSVGGLSCAHALLRAGCSVVVFEKARSIAPLGAGLVLDEVDGCPALREWGFGDALLQHAIPLPVEEDRLVDRKTNAVHSLVVNPLHNCKALHWSDLHKFLYDALPQGIVRWGHEVVGFEQIEDGKRVKVLVREVETGRTIEFEGDLLIAADGCNSRIRANFLPAETRRYSGYCAWRGVVDKAAEASNEAVMALRSRYPNLGDTVYVEMTGESHSVLFEIPGGRLNWLWYVDQPEPKLQGSSLTAKVGEEAIAKMIAKAEEVLTPEFVALIRVTESPFMQAICDRDPVKSLVWGESVVLLGEAAHPTTPHAARSTNMSIMDAFTLGDSISLCCTPSSSSRPCSHPHSPPQSLHGSHCKCSHPHSPPQRLHDDHRNSCHPHETLHGGHRNCHPHESPGGGHLRNYCHPHDSPVHTNDYHTPLALALARYESLRLPATTQQLLFSSFLGHLKQGHLHPKGFSWLHASPSDCAQLLQAHWLSFESEKFTQTCKA